MVNNPHDLQPIEFTHLNRCYTIRNHGQIIIDLDASRRSYSCRGGIFGVLGLHPYQDDTGARILSLIAENQAEPPPERKGMYTTVLRFQGEQSICLYFTGRRHAGENLDDLLAHRDPSLPPIQWMSDALAANTPKAHKDHAVDLGCLVHGRRLGCSI